MQIRADKMIFRWFLKEMRTSDCNLWPAYSCWECCHDVTSKGHSDNWSSDSNSKTIIRQLFQLQYLQTMNWKSTTNGCIKELKKASFGYCWRVGPHGPHRDGHVPRFDLVISLRDWKLLNKSGHFRKCYIRHCLLAHEAKYRNTVENRDFLSFFFPLKSDNLKHNLRVSLDMKRNLGSQDSFPTKSQPNDYPMCFRLILKHILYWFWCT